MTTDTLPKAASRQVAVGGRTVSLTGIAKGAGMIHPNMATMLAFVATDARVAQPLLEAALREATDRSFNRITVDGDTSTNDAFMLVATGQADMPEIAEAAKSGVSGVCRSGDRRCGRARAGDRPRRRRRHQVHHHRRHGRARIARSATGSRSPSPTRRW